MNHSESSLGARHPAHNYEYANAAARTGATGFVTADLYKLAVQTDDYSLWILTSTVPTWVEISGTAVASSINRIIVACRKNTAGTITKGQAVRVVGFDDGANEVLIELAQATTLLPCVGLADGPITDSVAGNVMISGVMHDVNTTSLVVGGGVYLSDSVLGGWTSTPPTGPSFVQPIGVCIGVHAIDGHIGVSALSLRALSNAVPLPVGTAAQGIAVWGSREDHIHAHGNQAGGSLHDDAIAAGASGFMTGADKTKLNGIAPGATSYSHPNHTGDVTSAGDGAQTIAALAVTDAKVATANKDGTAGTPSMRTLGTGSLQSCAGNDARLSDSRTPTAHAASHKNGGSDEVATATPAANAIPKADGTGKLAAGWLPATTAIFGANHQTVESTARSTSTESSPQNKLTMTTPALTGTYRIGWHAVVDQSSNSSSVEAQLWNSTNAQVVGVIQVHEPEDTDSRIMVGGHAHIVFSGAAKTFIIRYNTANGNTAGIADARIELWRVA